MNASHPRLSLPLLSPHEAAAVRVQRAQTELRQGRWVVVEPAQVEPVPGAAGAPLLLVAAVETLAPQGLQALRAAGVPLRLVLTAERLQALGWSEASTARSMALAVSAGLPALQAMVAVSPDAPDRALLSDPEVATPGMQAALLLAKRARLAPGLLVAEWPAARAHELRSAQLLTVGEHDVLPPSAGAAGAAAGARPPPPAQLQLQRVSDAKVPIAAHEDCTLVLFRELHGDAEHVAVIVGQPDQTQPVPVRLHSSCLTGDLLGSLRCDCGDQLQRAVEHLAQTGGVLLYLAQEGRGTGLASKLRAYRLQDQGLDTIDADRHLGFRGDERDFRPAVAMLQSLGIQRVQLLTNNPRKIAALRDGGIEVAERVALIATANAHNARYLQTKRERAGHLSASDEQE